MITHFALIFAAAAGGLGVVLGAFGAHGLRDTLEPRLMGTFETAVHYQMVHALAILLVVVLAEQSARSLTLEFALGAFMLGILLFSGSLYGLVLTDMKWLGPVTPVGGLCLIVGWLALLAHGISRTG